MGKMSKVLLTVGFLLGSAGALMAATGSQTFTVSATVPAPTSVQILTNSINSVGTAVFTPVTGSALSFDPLTFNTTNNIYLPNHYFSIDVGPAGGAGSTNVTLTYTEGTNPNAVTGGSGQGLGWKATGTFVKETGCTSGTTNTCTETPLTAHGGTSGKKLLKDISSENVTSTELGTGFFRIYLGVETNPIATGEPAGAQVFSAADKPGSYTGSLVVSATVS